MRKSITPLVVMVVAAVGLVIAVIVQFASSRRANSKPFHGGVATEKSVSAIVASDGQPPSTGAPRALEDSGVRGDSGYWSEATRDRIVPADAVPVVLSWSAIWPTVEGVPGLADAALRATAARMRPQFLLEPGQRLDAFAQRAAYGSRDTVLRSIVVRILETTDHEPLSRARLKTLVASFSDEATTFEIGADKLAYQRTFTRNAVTTRWQVDLGWDVLLDLVTTLAEQVSDRCQRILVRCAEQLRVESARVAQADTPPFEPMPVWTRPRIVRSAASAYELAIISDPFRFPEACRDVISNITEVVSDDTLNCR